MIGNIIKIMIKFLLISIIILLLIYAFFYIRYKDDKSTQTYNLEEWEKEFLYNTFTSEYQHNNIDNGTISESMKYELKNAKIVYDYLHQKYPSYSFKIKQMKLEGSPIPTETVYYFVEDGSEQQYKAIKYNDTFKDNFYNEIYSSKYSEFIIKNLEKYNIKIVSIYSKFTSYEDSSVDENMTLEEIEALKLGRISNIFVNNELGCTDEELINIVKDAGIHGEYNIFKSDLFKFDMTAEECQNIIINDEENSEKYMVTYTIYID